MPHVPKAASGPLRGQRAIAVPADDGELRASKRPAAASDTRPSRRRKTLAVDLGVERACAAGAPHFAFSSGQPADVVAYHAALARLHSLEQEILRVTSRYERQLQSVLVVGFRHSYPYVAEPFRELDRAHNQGWVDPADAMRVSATAHAFNEELRAVWPGIPDRYLLNDAQGGPGTLRIHDVAAWFKDLPGSGVLCPTHDDVRATFPGYLEALSTVEGLGAAVGSVHQVPEEHLQALGNADAEALYAFALGEICALESLLGIEGSQEPGEAGPVPVPRRYSATIPVALGEYRGHVPQHALGPVTTRCSIQRFVNVHRAFLRLLARAPDGPQIRALIPWVQSSTMAFEQIHSDSGYPV